MRLFLTAAIAMVLCAPAAALAGDGIYTYTEADGTVVYTNVAPGKAKRARRLAGTFNKAPRVTDAPTPLVKARRRATTYEDAIDTAATRYRIPPALVRAIMHAESNFDPMALSPKGASGLMQLMPETAGEMYVKDIFDPRDNIEGGTRYLRVLANMYSGDMVKMIAAYNAGPNAVNKYGGKVPPYAETQAYVRKVLQLYYQYKAQGEAAAAEAEAQVSATK